MVVIYGSRFYGKVDECCGQYAATRFAHIYWLPLFPIMTSTVWITEHDEEQYNGHKMRWHWKSIAAAYLRTWGVLLGSILTILALGNLSKNWPELFLGLPLLGFALYSLSWSKTTLDEAVRRNLFASITGTFCDPEYLPDNMVIDLRQRIENIWEQRFPTQTVDDIARFGAKEPAQAALAYSLLRLKAREADPIKEKALLALADTIAKGTSKEIPFEENPYRTDTSSFVEHGAK